MATTEVTILDLPSFTEYNDNDIVPVHDVSANITKKYTLDNILSGISTKILALANGSTATTQTVSDSSTKIATTEFVQNVVDDGFINFSTNTIALANGSTATTQAISDSSTKIATTEFVQNKIGDSLPYNGTAPAYFCRAWVKFDGSQSSITPINSGNISSVVKNGTGDYTINFTTAMDTADFVVNGLSGTLGSAVDAPRVYNTTTTSVSIKTLYTSTGAFADTIVYLSVIC